MPRGDLFPEIGPFETGYLPLAGGHVMYWEQVGNPRGAPVLFLHGGPGAGAGAVHRRFFDPSHWRVIIFDQRGAGRSRPLGSLDANTTPHLVERYRDVAAPSRHRPVAAVRRLLGFDAGARLRAGLPGARGRLRAARRVPRAARRRWTGSSTASASCSRTRTRPSSASCRRRNAATCCAPICAG